ncbi:MAG: winged helix-turn-helix transcriptional regulator [Candidatus Aenigmarchaeota archaeon]|nr:winged helix-turn-helix transcriptional regulator [Candidatus Aenigmarchaeota archaeon]
MRPDIVHKALGNEVRKEILIRLSKKEKYLTELAREMDMAPQTVDFHLNLLCEIGLVSYEWREGKKYYFLKDKKILDFLETRKPIPLHAHPRPPHEIMEEMLEDIVKRLERIEKKIDKLKLK